MALVKKKPKELKPQNDLDDIVDPEAVEPAEIRAFGKTLITLAEPPEPGDTIVLLMRLRVYDVGVEFNENGEGEGTPYRKMKLVSCWKPGTTEPVKEKTKAEKDAEAEKAAAENQPALYDDEPTGDDPQALGDILHAVPDVDDDTETETVVDRPDFSDGAQG